MAAQEMASAFENSKVGQFCKKAADAVSEFYEEHKAVINIVVGVVILAACTAATIATAGSCGFLYAVAAGALKGALIGAVTGAVGGLVTGAVEYYEENGTLDGSGKHLLESTAVGFAGGVAIGALAGGAAGAADEILRYAKNVDSFCFVAGTIILTADGTKPIEHIRIGDKVLSTDPETGETTEKIVLQTFERETTEFVDVTIDGETYTTTPEHPFYVEGKDFVNASELEAGDRVVCYDTETDTTETKEVEEVHSYETDEPVSVYNFEVHENHTYHVGEDGVLVHNACKKLGGNNSSGGSTEGIPSGYYKDATGKWHRPNGQFASNAEVGISSPAKVSMGSHGNSLSDPRTNYGYALIDKDTNEILKFGETLYPDTRYSKAYLKQNNAVMKVLDSGSKEYIHNWQHDLNMYFKSKYGTFPSLNKGGW